MKHVDPYWRLWGKLKARLGRDRTHEEEVEGLMDEDANIFGELAADKQEDYRTLRSVLKLPRREATLKFDGTKLTLDGFKGEKEMRGDRHAVNTLRKLDNDDQYFTCHFAPMETHMYANYRFSLTSEQQQEWQIFLRRLAMRLPPLSEDPTWQLLHDLSYADSWTQTAEEKPGGKE